MKKLALILPFIFASQLAFSQSHIPTGLDAERNLAAIGDSKTGTMIRTYDNRYEGVKGTPFLFEDWRKATVTKDNTIYQNVDIKYNVYEHEILYRSAKGEAFILAPSMVDSFVLTDAKTQQEYTLKKLSAVAVQEQDLLMQYVVVLFEGEQTQLIMAPAKNLMKADYKGAYSAGIKYDEFVDANTYYLIGPDKKAHKIKLNKKNLLKILPEKQIQAYVSSEKIDANTEAGWIKTLNFYNNLQK